VKIFDFKPSDNHKGPWGVSTPQHRSPFEDGHFFILPNEDHPQPLIDGLEADQSEEAAFVQRSGNLP